MLVGWSINGRTAGRWNLSFEMRTRDPKRKTKTAFEPKRRPDTQLLPSKKKRKEKSSKNSFPNEYVGSSPIPWPVAAPKKKQGKWMNKHPNSGCKIQWDPSKTRWQPDLFWKKKIKSWRGKKKTWKRVTGKVIGHATAGRTEKYWKKKRKIKEHTRKCPTLPLVPPRRLSDVLRCAHIPFKEELQHHDNVAERPRWPKITITSNFKILPFTKQRQRYPTLSKM